jgi:hypothetical protein
MIMHADISSTFASLGRLDGSAWTAQLDALAARIAIALGASAQITREHREHAPARRQPAQLALPIARRRPPRPCLLCGGAVLSRADYGPRPEYCSTRCRRAAADDAHARRRPPRDRASERRAARERLAMLAQGQAMLW